MSEEIYFLPLSNPEFRFKQSILWLARCFLLGP